MVSLLLLHFVVSESLHFPSSSQAEDAEKRRYETSSISAVSFINNRNRKNNVIKAELAIKEEIRRKELEGEEDSPFTRRKCLPRMVRLTIY